MSALMYYLVLPPASSPGPGDPDVGSNPPPFTRSPGDGAESPWASAATARGISSHSEIRRPENVGLLPFVVLFCNYVIRERRSLLPTFVLCGRARPQRSLEAAYRPCVGLCDHFLPFIFAEVTYLWLNLAQPFRSHWYTSKKFALLDENRLKVWTQTSTVWTLRAVRSGRQLLLGKNQESTKWISSIFSFISNMANAFITSEEKCVLDFHSNTCLGG